MARKFNGTTDCGAVTLDLSGESAITIGAWAWWDAFANNDHLMMEYSAGGAAAGECLVNPNESGSGGWALSMGTGAINWADNYSRASFTAAQWFHALFVFDRATPANKFWFNGGLQTATSSSHAAGSYGNFANSTLNLMCRNGASLFAAGRMCELTVWSGDIGQAVADGIRGRKASTTTPGQSSPNPFEIHPDNILLYAPLIGDSTEHDYSGHNHAVALTGTTVANHTIGRPFLMQRGFGVQMQR